MARKRHSDEDILKLLREIEMHHSSGSDVPTAYRAAGISDAALRREVFNVEWFVTTRQAQIVIATWLRQYNHIRPHQALDMRAPVPETI
jgi:hypothetical protein